MSNETTLTIRGNLGGNPTLYAGASGGFVARFTVASSVSRFNRAGGQIENLRPQWFDVKAFGALAQNAAASLAKGTPVLVRGELVTEYWANDRGEEHSRQVLRADSVAVDLRTGVAHFQKLVRGAASAEAQDGKSPLDVSDAVELPDGETSGDDAATSPAVTDGEPPASGEGGPQAETAPGPAEAGVREFSLT